MWTEFTNKNFKLLKNKIIINKLFINKVKEIRHQINNTQNVNYTINLIKIPTEKIIDLQSSEWVSTDLNYDNLTYEINISWMSNNIYLKTTKNKFLEIKNRLPTFLKLINYIQNKSNCNINLYLVLSPLKKYIETNKIISPKHINSGYTHTVDKEIFIWREEEFEKVTFHELIHLFDKDHRHEIVDLDININGPESYYEAITDFKAIIYNVIYLSLVTRRKIETILNYEILFIHNLAKMILANLNNCKNNNIIIQKSPAYSYFVLKYFIFKYFINRFNNKIFDDIFFQNKNYDRLIDLIKNYKLYELVYIDFKSGRMTLFELK
jgi:hypothetical protein